MFIFSKLGHIYSKCMAKIKKETKQEPLEKTLWAAADKLRKNMDAAEYKHIVLGLIFLKYISDAFDEVYQAFCKANGKAFEKDKTLLGEFKDECLAENVFYVPSQARWNFLLAQAKQPTIGKIVDEAMDTIETQNPTLKGVLPKQYARTNLDKGSLGGLIDLIGSIELGNKEAKSQDVLGQIYEYFLGQFALAEGKKGGQFYTPQSVVKLLTEIIEPYHGRVFDPCCGSGGMFVQSEKFVLAHQGKIDDISIYGQESNQTTYRLARMNLALRGIDGSNIRWNNEGSFLKDAHPDLKADFIIANPPFNDSDWSGSLLKGDGRWKFGVPPTGNANFAWIQHFLYHLSPSGIAGFVMHGGAASNKGTVESQIREKLVENDLIEAIIALPTQLFYNTTLPVHIWVLSRNKNATKKLRDRKKEVLMIDAYDIGTMIESTQRILTENDIDLIANSFRDWRSLNQKNKFKEIEGFSKVVSLNDIKTKGFIISPNRFLKKKKKPKGERFAKTINGIISKTFSLSSSIAEDISNEKINSNSFAKNFLKFYDKKFDVSNWDLTEVSEVIESIISGEWGKDEPKEGYTKCKIVRGTDLPNIPLFNLRKMPTRYVGESKIEERRLKKGDLVVEMSGGSKDQPTGRCAYITEEFLNYFDMPILCSNFCKIIRVNESKVHPFWFFYYWQMKYNEGITTRYENQPSGIKNFQLDEYIASELIQLPKKKEQEIIVEKIKAVYDLKNKMSCAVNSFELLLSESFEKVYNDLE